MFAVSFDWWAFVQLVKLISIIVVKTFAQQTPAEGVASSRSTKLGKELTSLIIIQSYFCTSLSK